MEKIRLEVFGLPAPQGSKRIMRGRLIEASGDKLKRWRKAIAAACELPELGSPILGPVAVTVTFYLPRPASVKFAKRPFPIVPPDLDKLARGVLDGVGQSGVIWGDDAQVIKLVAEKYYADEREPGATIRIYCL
jgi:Holliday junction resolvase RusA-like endonuclease